ncbi:MAG: 16S rRNA (guanine(966)-N(2))-methyltransferase RsmD [Betaproteobacteria bacterium]|nr:16S rRNA (guanine(966)-N(2))-methyltransferase RsmD [Betaproteobacteria bacterium]
MEFYRSAADLSPVPAPNRVRIIGGRHRGRQVRVPDAPGLRPTPDRVRETLFNWLGQDLTGARTLDLYAGTGILTLEACSRGAALSVAVDRNPALIRALRGAAEAMGIDALETHVGDALIWAARETRDFDVIFADPPFAEDPWPALFGHASRLLAPHGRLYAEAGRMLSPPPQLSIVRHAKAGQVHYHLLAPAVPP